MRSWAKPGLALFVLMAALPAGCSKDDTDHLARIGNILAERSETIMANLKEDFSVQWKNLETRSEQRALNQRVTSRLRQEKCLMDARITVSTNGNVVELKGEVKSLDQRRRAVDLAESTVGVSEVRDHLEMIEP